MKKRSASAEKIEALPTIKPSLMRPLGDTELDFPLADAFFSEAVIRRNLSHGYILKGPAYGAMYRLILQLARIVNCRQAGSRSTTPLRGDGSRKQLADLACGECTDCRWVEQNTHPAVLTISRLTYLVSDSGEDLSPDALEKLAAKGSTSTQIKAEQIERLLGQLALSSDYTRVVIFTDAEEWPAEKPSDITAPFEWRHLAANDDKSFHIRPLERRLFNHASANRFLKTLEEPPPRTLFFFITETEEQVLETIVSRCQVLPCQPGRRVVQTLDGTPEEEAFLHELATRLGMMDVFEAVERFEAFFIQEKGLSLPQALDAFQGYWRKRYLTETLALTTGQAEGISTWKDGESAFRVYRQTQEALALAHRQIDARVNETQTLLHCFLSLKSV
jgi:DNA polymerase III delta prime subunit